jgi:hypothetical protein
MEAARVHAIMLVFAALFASLGRLIARNPETAHNFFTLGMRPTWGSGLGVTWCRFVGRLFTVVFSFGAILYLVMIPTDILRHR